jgi:arylsulfatase A-like enzyme
VKKYFLNIYLCVLGVLFRTGPGVLKNNSLEGSFVSILDVVPTALNAIGVDKSEFMRGQVLEQIYP